MSYDINIYTSKKMDDSINTQLIEKYKMKRSGRSLAIEGKTWQILMSDKTYNVEEEDIPETVYNKVPGLSYGLDINLEPIGAPKTAYDKLYSITRFVTKELRGVGIDEQLGELILPNKSRGLKLEQPVDKRIDLLTFSWWFDNDFLESKKDYNILFDTIKKYCPEFLPKRYGLYEPPQFKIEEQGIEHFLSFIWDNKSDFTVIYTKKPFYSISLPSIKESYYNRHGFCPKKFGLQVDARVLEVEGWEITLKRLWKKLNEIIQPIYSDVCIIEDYIDMRRTVGSDNRTGCHQVKISWKGIPENNGIAAYIGEPYKSKLCLKTSEYSSDPWANKEFVQIPDVSSELRQTRVRIKPDYEDFPFNRFETYHAEDFPFEKPDNYEVFSKPSFWSKLKNWGL